MEIARNLPDQRLLFQGLKRTRATDSQANKSARARARNVAGAFAVTDRNAIKGANILLIDDVVTSGATARAAAKTAATAAAVTVGGGDSAAAGAAYAAAVKRDHGGGAAG